MQSFDTIDREAAEHTYRDVERLISLVAYDFAKHHGGEAEEWLNEARIVFLRCYFTWDKRRAPFVKYLAWEVRNTLHEVYVKNARRNQLLPRTDLPIHLPARESISFRLEEFTLSLSTDAQYIVNIALRHPPDLARTIKSKGGSVCKIRASMRQWLKQIHGWDRKRINQTFLEIRKAL